MIYAELIRDGDSLTQIYVTGITALTTILVAIVGIYSAHHISNPRTPKEDPDNSGRRKKNKSVLASYSGDQNEFISLVIQDSKELHARLDRNEKIVEQLKKDREAIVGAFGRYIAKLAKAWGGDRNTKMPYPDDEDLAILEDTLPADWRHRINLRR